MNKNGLAFIEAAEEMFGVGATLTRDDINKVVNEKGVGYPYFFVTKSEYRGTNRGTYILPDIGTQPKQKTVKQKEPELEMAMVAQVMQLRQPKLIDESDPFDLWLHVENYPSGHVVIREKLLGKNELEVPDYPNQIIAIGADYCKSQSKYAHYPKLKIVYTQIANLKKGKDVGSVFISKEKFIYV